MKKFVLTLSAMALGTVAASAADISPRTYSKAPVMAAPAYDWSGFYIGGEVGGAQNRFDGYFLNPDFANFGSRRTTGVGGGFVGAQYQFSSNIVVGLEANIVAMFDRSLGGGSCVPATPCGVNNMRSVVIDPISSAGARFGYALGTWLPYATAGFAETRMGFLGVDATPANESYSQFRLGWYAGAGIDYMINPNWIVGAEYRHYDFGTETGAPFDNLVGGNATFDTVNVHLRSDTVMVRASYKFGFGGPVIARY